MKAVVSSKRPCALSPGEIRRVPQDRSYRGIVGYHVCCARCGFVTAVLNGHNGVAIEESGDAVVSFSEPVRCAYCGVIMRLDRGEWTLEEDEKRWEAGTR